MIERFLARAGRLDEHAEVGARRLLPDEIRQPLRAERMIGVGRLQGGREGHNQSPPPSWGRVGGPSAIASASITPVLFVTTSFDQKRNMR